MAITVNTLIEEMRDYFHLNYLTGEENGEHVVTWVHLTEDASVADLFTGNELVVTSGYAARDEESLLRFIDAMAQKDISGVVINVGQYILDVPKSAAELCDRYGIPLLTMPWEMSATDFAKACCIQIEREALEVEGINQAAMRAIQSPNHPAGYLAQLGEYFDEAAGFQVLVVSAHVPGEDRRIALSRASLRIHTALYKWGFQFLLFQMDQRFVLILNQRDPSTTDEIAAHIVEMYQLRGWNLDSIHIGIGMPVDALSALAKSYHAALSALRCGTLQARTIQRFSDMGFYKLLYSVPDDAILEEYYEQRLAPLLAYDREHDGSYVETLFRYLLHDGSLSAVAEEMYTHRNTVGYRMGKIRELLGLSLDSQYDRFPLILAFHIGVILGKVSDYEAEINAANADGDEE